MNDANTVVRKYSLSRNSVKTFTINERQGNQSFRQASFFEKSMRGEYEGIGYPSKLMRFYI